MDLVCSDPLHASRSAQPGWAATLGTASVPVVGMLCQACANDPTGAYQTRATAQAAFTTASVAQSASVATLLAGASNLRDDLTATRADLAAKASTYASARSTLVAAITALPATPTLTQVGTFVRGPLAVYLGIDNDVTRAVGISLDATVGDLDAVIRGLANFIAHATGSTTVLV